MKTINEGRRAEDYTARQSPLHASLEGMKETNIFKLQLRKVEKRGVEKT